MEYSIKFNIIHSDKITIENINYNKREFNTFYSLGYTQESINNMSKELQNLKVRRFIEEGDRNFESFFIKFIKIFRAYFSGRIRVRYHIKDHKNFGVDIYLKNMWSGYNGGYLNDHSFFDFDFYLNLLLEKISYYSEKNVIFFMEIDFDLEGKHFTSRRKTKQLEEESYIIFVYR